MVIATLFISLAVLIVIGAPIAVCIGFAPIAALVADGQASQLFVAAQRMVTALDSTVLVAIPLFVLAGVIMGKGGISKQIVNLCYELFGWMPGSLGVVTVIACMFFDDGYPAGFSAALAASAGIIGCIIPPSIPFVNYALITGESVSDLFAAGVVPGILMGVVLCIWTIILANKYGWGSRKKGISLRGVWKAFCSAIYAILMPVIILGGIYSGLFTPTEAAAVAAVYGAIVSLFIYRGIKLRDMLDIGFEAVRTSCMIMFICATANIFSFVVTRQQVPAKLSSLILGVTDNWVVILLIINVILLINGCFMETTASTYIYTPILFPLISALGYNPIQFGVVMVMNLTLGLITPPLGINLFVAQGVDRRVSFGAQVKQVMPMFILLVVVLMLVTYIPGLSLCLIGGGN